MRIQLKKSFWRQQWHFVVIASNNKVIATSENYFNRLDAVMMMQKIHDHLGHSSMFDEDEKKII